MGLRDAMMRPSRSTTMLPLALSDTAQPLRVLAIGAHADDLEIGAGCTLQRLARLPRADVRCVVATGDEERNAEATASARAWLGEGVQVDTWGLPVSLLPTRFEEVKQRLWALARDHEPDLVLTHAIHDRHQDHRVLGEVTWQTFRAHLILEYEIPKFEGDLGTPSLYVPLSAAEVEAKCQHLLQAFPSQAQRSWFTPETFKALARLRGVECAAAEGYAEAFHSRKATLTLS